MRLPSQPLMVSECPDLPLLARGKVRDVYDLEDGTLLFVATDRLSAFDVIMKNGVPGKGILLTQISRFWFEWLGDSVAHHVLSTDMGQMPFSVHAYRDQLEGRCMRVRKLKVLPVESIVRGYLAGSGWKSYQNDGSVCGISLPEGLQQCDRLPEPLFTPSSKAEQGDHDINITPEEAADLIGAARSKRVQELSLDLYTRAAEYTAKRGILLADTKFEFGVDPQGQVVLADEILTPDSSRFWPADDYTPGRDQQSFDKQFVRNYLESIDFDKETPVELPNTVVQNTLDRYIEACERLTSAE